MFPQEHTYQQERDSSPLEADPRDFPGARGVQSNWVEILTSSLMELL